MAQPTALEQYMLELTNAERAKAGAQPLAFEDHLNQAADGHNDWMIATDTFSHTGQNGSQPTDRIKAAGYTLEGAWSAGENIAWASTRAPAGNQDEVQLLNTNLMNSPDHRANILNGDFRQVGIGVQIGEYQGQESAFAAQDFARSSSGPFLTGVAFNDQDGDKAYDPNEGLGGVKVTAKDASGRTFETTTLDAGGYQMELPAGTYDVAFSRGGTAELAETVSIGDSNVKLDFVPAAGANVTAATPPLAASATVDETPAATLTPTLEVAETVTGSAPGAGSDLASSPGATVAPGDNPPVLITSTVEDSASPSTVTAAPTVTLEVPQTSDGAGTATPGAGSGAPTAPLEVTVAQGGDAGAPTGSTDEAATPSADSLGQEPLEVHHMTTEGLHDRQTLAGEGRQRSGHGGRGRRDRQDDVLSLASMLDADGGLDRDVITGFSRADGDRAGRSEACCCSDALQPSVSGQGTSPVDRQASLLSQYLGGLQNRSGAEIGNQRTEAETDFSKAKLAPGVDLTRHG